MINHDKASKKRVWKLAPYRTSTCQELHCFPYFCQLELQVCAKSATGQAYEDQYHQCQLNLYKWKVELLGSYMKREHFKNAQGGMLHEFGVYISYTSLQCNTV